MIPISDVAHNLFEGVLRILGVGLMVVIGLGQASVWTGYHWLGNKAVRISGVLLGLAVIIASSHLVGAMLAWLQGGQ